MCDTKVFVLLVALCLSDQAVSHECTDPEEFLPIFWDCTSFVNCANGNPYVKKCPPGMVFSAGLRTCVFRNSSHDDCTAPVTAGTGTDTGGTETGTAVRVIGDLSASTTNARSTAICPTGSVVLNCVCNREGNQCSGSNIAGQRCRAFNAGGGSGQRAIAVCLFDSEGNWRLVPSSVTSLPEAVCPGGFLVTACTLYNRMTHQERVVPTLDRARNSCRATIPCRFGTGCSTQAICRRGPE